MSKAFTIVAFFVIATVLNSSVVLNFLAQNKVLKETVVTLQETEDRVYYAKLFEVPLLVCGVKVDLAIKLSSYLKVICELTLGKNRLQFCLNDLSLSYSIEEGRLQLDGEVSKFGSASFKATINTDGIIQGVPKLVLYYI
jgi:hypothetical protein